MYIFILALRDVFFEDVEKLSHHQDSIPRLSSLQRVAILTTLSRPTMIFLFCINIISILTQIIGHLFNFTK